MERRALPALALTTNTSILSAIGNDYHYNEIFVRQVEAWGKKGDVLLAISTSGQSPNVLKAVQYAHSIGMKTVALTGKSGGALKEAADISLIVPSNDTQRIQETHITIGHILCDLIEQGLFLK
jgi:D-sedoheptulose 7-phosphate isomerase